MKYFEKLTKAIAESNNAKKKELDAIKKSKKIKVEVKEAWNWG